MSKQYKKGQNKTGYTNKTITGQVRKSSASTGKVKAGTKYKVPKTGNNGVNFKELQKLVKRYNSQRSAELSKYKGRGDELDLVRSGAVRPRIKGGASGLAKNIRSEEELAKTLDMLNNQVKRKNSKSRADVYTGRLEKKTGKKYSREELYLPRSKDETVRWRFYRMLTEGSSIDRSIIKKLVGDYNVVTGELKTKGTLSTDDMVKFMLDEPKLVGELYEYYKAEGMTSRRETSKKLNEALLKREWISKKEAKGFN